MATRIQKWGNSLAVRLPKEVAENLGLREGSDVEVVQKAGTLVIRSIPEPELKLEDLLAKITPQNRHPETDWGPSVGKEIIEEW